MKTIACIISALLCLAQGVYPSPGHREQANESTWESGTLSPNHPSSSSHSRRQTTSRTSALYPVFSSSWREPGPQDYIWQRLNQQVYREKTRHPHAAAAVIPIAVEDGKRFVLMGIQRKTRGETKRYNKTWTFLGGGRSKWPKKGYPSAEEYQEIIEEEYCPVNTAAREAFEESVGKLGDIKAIRRMIYHDKTERIKNYSYNIDGRTPFPVPSFIFPFEKSKLPRSVFPEPEELEILDWLDVDCLYRGMAGRTENDFDEDNLVLEESCTAASSSNSARNNDPSERVVAKYSARMMFMNRDVIERQFERLESGYYTSRASRENHPNDFDAYSLPQ